MANQYKGNNELRLRVPDEVIEALRARPGYVPKRRGISSGDSHEIKKILYEALDLKLVDQHEKQAEMYSSKKNPPNP